MQKLLGRNSRSFAPYVLSNHFYPCYPRTNKINFSLRFFISKESVFSRGNFNFLKRHSWLDNWIDCLPLFASLLCIFARLKEKLSLEKCADWWVVIFESFCASCVSDIIAFSSPFFSFHCFTSSVSKSTPRVFMVKNLDDASKKILEQWVSPYLIFID